MNRTVALGAPTVGQDELDAIKDGLRSPDGCRGRGPRAWPSRTSSQRSPGAQHVLATSNCGSALHLGAAGARMQAGRRDHRRRLHLPGHRPRGDVGRRDPGLRRRAPRHLDRRPGCRRGRDHAAHGRDHRRRRPSASPPTTTRCARSPTATACGSSKTPPARLARPTADARPARSPMWPRSASTAARASPPARAARSRATASDLVAHARKLHTYGIEPAISREGLATLPVPVVRRARLQLPALRRPGRDHARPGQPPARAARRRETLGDAVRTSCWAISSRSPCRSRSRTARTRGSPTCSPWRASSTADRVAAGPASAGRRLQLRHVRVPPAASVRRAAVAARLGRPVRPAPRHPHARQPDRGRRDLRGGRRPRRRPPTPPTDADPSDQDTHTMSDTRPFSSPAEPASSACTWSRCCSSADYERAHLRQHVPRRPRRGQRAGRDRRRRAHRPGRALRRRGAPAR